MACRNSPHPVGTYEYYKFVADEGLKLMKHLLSDHAFKNEWVDTGIDPQVGMNTFEREFEGSDLKIYLGRKVLEVPYPILLKLLHEADETQYKTWDENCAEFTIKDRIENLYEDAIVEYILADLPWPIYKRDICQLHCKTTEDNRLYLWYQSCEHPQAPVKTGEAVRVFMALAGWALEPADGLPLEQSQKLVATRFIHMDPNHDGGYIPQFLINAAHYRLIGAIMEKIEKHGKDAHQRQLSQTQL